MMLTYVSSARTAGVPVGRSVRKRQHLFLQLFRTEASWLRLLMWVSCRKPTAAGRLPTDGWLRICFGYKCFCETISCCSNVLSSVTIMDGKAMSIVDVDNELNRNSSTISIVFSVRLVSGIKSRFTHAD